MDKEDQEGENVDTNKNQSSSEQQQTQANDDSSERNKKYSSITDSALDSILDEYSQDAKKTEKITIRARIQVTLKHLKVIMPTRIHNYQQMMN